MNQQVKVFSAPNNINQSTGAIRSYLANIGRVPLLKREEEIQYGRQIQTMLMYEQVKVNLVSQLGQEPSWEEWASALEVTIDELEEGLEAGVLAREMMVKANLRLVVNIAKHYQNHNVDLLDLIQEGSIGLHQGAEKFDPTRGYKFSTYAYWWIRQAITRSISQYSRTIRLPLHLVEILTKIKQSQRELQQQLGRNPSIQEIANYLDLDPEKVQQYLNHSRRPLSLEKRIGKNGETELQDVLEDPSISPSENLEKVALSQDLQAILAQLPPVMHEVIVMRFGLNGERPLSLTEAGKRLQMSRERVRQLQQKAFKVIRHRNPEIRQHIAG